MIKTNTKQGNTLMIQLATALKQFDRKSFLFSSNLCFHFTCDLCVSALVGLSAF